MTTINPEQIILGPMVTEKTISAQSRNVYSFWVSPRSSKSQIYQAFVSVFGIKPVSIRTSMSLGKVKMDARKRMPVQKPTRKKAHITLAKDQKIELLNFNTK